MLQNCIKSRSINFACSLSANYMSHDDPNVKTTGDLLVVRIKIEQFFSSMENLEKE